MNVSQNDGNERRQVADPDQGNPPRTELAPGQPTVPADAADVETVDASDETAAEHAPRPVPGSDLDPDEAADLMETREEAGRIKQAREDQQDEGLITLDSGD